MGLCGAERAGSVAVEFSVEFRWTQMVTRGLGAHAVYEEEAGIAGKRFKKRTRSSAPHRVVFAAVYAGNAVGRWRDVSDRVVVGRRSVKR